MLGDQSAGMGRTVRTTYDNASQVELLRIFGDEAPDPTKVLKVSTTDPNNVTSIAYVGEGGNTIATCLTFNEEDDLLDPLKSALDAESSTTITKESAANTQTAGGLASSVRFMLTNSLPVSFDYSIKCKTLNDACLGVDIDCGFKVRLELYNEADPETLVASYEKDLDEVACSNELKTVNWANNTMAKGTYFLNKYLIAENDVDAQTADLVNLGDARVRPLADMLASWLGEVYNSSDLTVLFGEINSYNADLQQVLAGSQDMTVFLENYNLPESFPLNADHYLTLTPAYDPLTPTVLPTHVEFSGCCGPILVPLEVPGEVGYDCPEPITLANSPDFEAYVIDKLEITNESDWNVIMPGFRYQQGDFNTLIYKMLTDQYDYEGSTGPHYQCDELWQCWKGLVETYNDIKAANGNYNVADGVDEQNDGDPSGFNEPFDNAEGGGARFLNFIIKKALSARMRDEGPEVRVNLLLPELFMECVGRKFANMVVFDPNGGPYLQGPLPGDAQDYDAYRIVAADYGDLEYPFQTNPWFLYKYFEYVDLSKPYCEQMTCYTGPTTGSIAVEDLCEDELCFDGDYALWSEAEETNFFNVIKIYDEIPDSTENDPDPNLSCEDLITTLKLEEKRTDFIDDCNSACDDRYSEFVAKITAAFVQNCYRVEDGCPEDDDVVSYSDIQAIATSMVADCKTNYCPLSDPNFDYCIELSNCERFDYYNRVIVSESPYRKVQITLPCEKSNAAMAQTWEVEVTLPSKCTGEEGQLEDWANETPPVEECDQDNIPTSIDASRSRQVDVSSDGN